MKKLIHCPSCKKEDTWTNMNTYRPFCSKRCQLIDLGEWASESYRVVSKQDDDSDKEWPTDEA